ncbi:MAG TPA: PDZ domain-containing protein [Candidatus Acidoferrales bacterium]|nr:PDZ domain-containing protein [Candidatus Acidoferrales bacterium]
MKRRYTIFLVFISAWVLGVSLETGLRGQAPATSPQENTAPAQFAYSGSAAQAPATFISNHLFLPVRINLSKPSLFELDSTATATSVDPSRLTDLAIPIDASNTNIQNCVLNLPGVELPMSNLAIVAKNDFGAQMGMPYQGTLGADFFARLVVVVDYSRQTIQLYDPATYTYSGAAKGVQGTFAGATPILHAKVSIPGQKTLEADFIVDTALDFPIVFSRTFTDEHRISSAHFKTISASYPSVDAGAKILLGRLKTIQLGGYTIEDPIAAFSQSNPPSGQSKNIAGTIGAGFLKRFLVIFDSPHQRIILEPNLQFNKFAEEDMSGLSIVAKGPGLRTFEIVRVQPGTPGASAGIHEGDVIAGIDEEPAADITLTSIRDLFRQVGHKYKLLIERNGKTQEVVIQMKRLI